MSDVDRLAAVLERALVDLRLPRKPRRKIPVKIVKGSAHVDVKLSIQDILDMLKVLGAKIDKQGLDIKALRKYLRLTPDSTDEPSAASAPMKFQRPPEPDKIP